MELLAIVLGIILLLPILAVLQGTILYFIWPVVMVDVFHLPVLTWWQAVCLTWVCGILLKSSHSSKSKD